MAQNRYSLDADQSVREVSSYLGVSEGVVRAWIGKGSLSAKRVGRAWRIPIDQQNAAFMMDHRRANDFRPTPAYVPPAISRYSRWHEVLDELVWQTKVLYSEPANLKKRKFRLDVLFANYLASNGVDVSSLSREFSSSKVNVSKGVWEDLQRWWYNELAFSYPARPSALGLSFSDITKNQEASADRFTFPSWRITTAYYSVYFYLRALARLKQPSFQLQEHKATFRNFKACVLSPLEKTVWHYPLNIAWRRGQRQTPAAIKHLQDPKLTSKYEYSRHPREPHRSPAEIHRHVLSVFARQAPKGLGSSPYTVLDYLYDFRVWANYLEIEHLLNLRGEGYKAFLDQSLAFLLFFIGGITELVLLSASTQAKFLNRSQRFYSALAASSDELDAHYLRLPLAQRLVILQQIGCLTRGVAYSARDEDNRVRVNFNDV